ncbi:MAG: glycosyltransferase [Kastovskya adunca ATA6-11-RM4]|jgi:glycosyltransferase involved in cell wall biosynthesis|nr:glycosyltransferase [Kastovskya adunca ATA6-11-RM4]
MPKVSVIIPVYKVEQYIAATVQSVLDQTYEDFELLIVDDGSPDRSVEICQQFADPRIKIIRQENQGVSTARNTGIAYAQGQYLAFIDGDDLWVPEKLEKHVQHLETSPQVGVSYSYSAFIDASGVALGIYQTAKTEKITPAYIFRRNPVGNGSTPVIRREVFEAIHYRQAGASADSFFDRELHNMEDVECWLRIAIQTDWLLEGLPEALTLYRIHSKGHSANLQKHLSAVDNVVEKTRAYAPEIAAQCEKPARAYALRFLSRRAVTLRDGAKAAELLHRALMNYWQIVLEEPRRTLLTFSAVYTLWLLPQSLYCQIEALALKVTGANQKRQIQQQSQQSV